MRSSPEQKHSSALFAARAKPHPLPSNYAAGRSQPLRREIKVKLLRERYRVKCWLCLAALCLQTQTKCLNNFENGIKTRAALTGERFVKTFSGKFRIARNLCHALGASDVSQRFRDEGASPSASTRQASR